MQDKVIITAALTGAVTPKSMNANMPITPQEIAEDAYKCWKAGAAIVHLHMRDDEANGTMDVNRFRETIELLRAKKDCDVVLCCTSSGTRYPLPNAARMEHFKTIPDIELGSYDSGTFNWGATAIFENSPQFLVELAQCYNEHGVKPEIEIFDTGMMGNAIHLIKGGYIKEPIFCQFCLGILGGAPASVENLIHLLRHMPEGSKWSAFGIGKNHLPIMYAALALGAHGIRVGLEDNVLFAKDVLASNVMMVERAVRIVKEFAKQPATPTEAREILGLKPLAR